jgi:uncharacterized protein
MASTQAPNRLIHEKSPYLLQHAYNPVDWYPWGEQAFSAAQSQNKPIFLSIGYSTCHWCHVMERESFENPGLAQILNRHFISVKVDREERPDVDRVYMTFVQSTTGSGGWPMSVFLTPDRKPFFGGTYFPPVDAHGRPGFATLLTRVSEIWDHEKDKILNQAEHFTAALRTHLEPAPESRPWQIAWLDKAYQQLSGSFDPEEGGFSDAPKFPRPSVLMFLFRHWYRKQAQAALDMPLFTLQKMAEGGMYDHLGGGFHRYSVDARWHVPHFEKMLYDQAQLVMAYCEAYQITGEVPYKTVADHTLDYVLRDLRSSTGAFFSAEDADSQPDRDTTEKREGAFYVWTQTEIDQVLDPDQAQVFRRAYGIEVEGNVSSTYDPHGELSGQNIISRQTDTETIAKLTGKDVTTIQRLLLEARDRLKLLRDRRPRPHLDDKIVTAWNGLMISALARASRQLRSSAYLEAAEGAAEFFRQEMYPGQLLRSYRNGPGETHGFAEDYACLIQGLLDLYEAGFQIHWLQWAKTLQIQMDELFSDPAGGYFSTGREAPDILFRLQDDHDGAEPSANSVAFSNALRLGRLLNRSEFIASAERIAYRSSSILEQSPAAIPYLCAGLETLAATPIQVVVAGDRGSLKPESPLMDSLYRHYRPELIVLHADGGAAQEWLGEHVEAVREMKPVGDQVTFYVCQNFTCDLPVTDPEELEEKLRT